jgi:diaminopimelate epimerase
MRFTKMQGAGNDYVYVDCFREKVPTEVAPLAIAIADRHFGVGGDGLILIGPSERADAKMRMFNADGSESEMCGNGLRCVAKYVYDHGIATKPQLRIETGRGILTADIEARNGRAQRVRLNMGEPILNAAQIPTTLPGNPPQDVDLNVGDVTLKVTCVSMGNPHCVTFLDAITDQHVLGLGPTEATMRVWERGSGETLACGTGACAVAVAGVLTGRLERTVLIHLLGGDLEIEWSAADNQVYLTGPAVEVFSGDWPVS